VRTETSEAKAGESSTTFDGMSYSYDRNLLEIVSIVEDIISKVVLDCPLVIVECNGKILTLMQGRAPTHVGECRLIRMATYATDKCLL